MARTNEWGESLEQTIQRSRIQNGLLVYSMAPGEIIRVAIDGTTPEGVVLDQSRQITAEAFGDKQGRLRVLEDTVSEDSWQSRVLCLGSYAFTFAGLNFDSPGILRGMIAHRNGVVVDLDAEHFTGPNPPTRLMAEYSTLTLEDELIF